MKISQFLLRNHAHMNIYITGAKHALNYRGFDDYMVYYTLLAMGIPREHIDYIGKDGIHNMNDINGWIELDSTNLPDKVIGTINFKGATLFKNEFIIDDLDKNNYIIQIQPEDNLKESRSSNLF